MGCVFLDYLFLKCQQEGILKDKEVKHLSRSEINLNLCCWPCFFKVGYNRMDISVHHRVFMFHSHFAFKHWPFHSEDLISNSPYFQPYNLHEVNLFTPKILLAIPLTVYHTIRMMLVLRILCWINQYSVLKHDR